MKIEVVEYGFQEFWIGLKWDFLLNSICKTISFIYSQVKRRKEIQKIWWELASQSSKSFQRWSYEFTHGCWLFRNSSIYNLLSCEKVQEI